MDALAEQYEGRAILEADDERRAMLRNQSIAYRVVIADMTAQLADAIL